MAAIFDFFFIFLSLTLVWLWISSPNFNSKLLVYMGRSLLIFSNVTSKMAAWQPYWIFSCDQAALWMVFSVRPSVWLSHLFDYVPFIVSSWNFQELLPMTEVTSMQGSRSEVKFQGHMAKKNRRFWPKFGVSGLQLQFEFRYDDEMMHRAWCYLGEVPYCFSRSSVNFQGHTAKKNNQIGHFRTATLVWIHWWLWNDAQSLKQHRRGALLFFNVIRQISR